MKIMYHIANEWAEDQIKLLNKEGHYPKPGYSAYQIEEPEYLRLENQFKQWGVSGV